jgi:hypothetical protein
MSERWLPVLAAALGLIGGVAGAAIGGLVANQGQAQRLEAERAARLRDLRTNTYLGFLRAAENEHIHAPEFEDAVVETAAAEVALVAGSGALRAAAVTLREHVVPALTSDEDYREARDRFIALASDEIEASA